MNRIKVLSIIVLSFIVTVPIGTLTHELGHIATASFLGFDTTLHFGSMYFDDQSRFNLGGDLLNFLVTLSGPFVTLAISFLGLGLINNCSISKIHSRNVPLNTIIYLLMSLFVSREIFIGLTYLL